MKCEELGSVRRTGMTGMRIPTPTISRNMVKKSVKSGLPFLDISGV
jgi:hypothetical protein